MPASSGSSTDTTSRAAGSSSRDTTFIVDSFTQSSSGSSSPSRVPHYWHFQLLDYNARPESGRTAREQAMREEQEPVPQGIDEEDAFDHPQPVISTFPSSPINIPRAHQQQQYQSPQSLSRTASQQQRSTDSSLNEDEEAAIKPPALASSGGTADNPNPLNYVREGVAIPGSSSTSASYTHNAEETSFSSCSDSDSSSHSTCATSPDTSLLQRQQKLELEREKERAYIRPCSFLRPGSVFSGSQSFTAYISASTAVSSSVPNPFSHTRGATPYISPVEASIASYRNRRQQPHPSAQYPFSAFARELPSWNDLQGSAIDPRIQALLGAIPYVDYPTGDSTARISTKEEWEVQVSIISVDYEKGKVTGVMMAKNVPSTVTSLTSTLADPSSKASGSTLDNTVTTSFEGEIVDLHNSGIWTRSSPDNWQSYLSSNSSSDLPTSSRSEGFTSWLAQNGSVDKTTDLEYWSKVEAFSSFGATASKEICRIAEENRWTPMSRKWMSDPRDYVLMRWKEREFIDCEAQSSGLTISGFYYICLNRRTGALSGYYYDPHSTPHQRLDLQPARTKVVDDRMPANGGVWFGSHDVL